MILHADGRHAPGGVTTWAFVVLADDGTRLHAASGLVACAEGAGTSLLAEWTAVVEALRWVRGERPGEAIRLRIDSALVAKALKDRSVWVKGAEGALVDEARRHVLVLKGWRAPVTVERVPRWKNNEADALTHLAALDALAAGNEEPEPEPEPLLEQPGVPPPAWRTYAHRDAKGRIRKGRV